MKQGTDFASEDLESELAQLRLTLEERDHELRQRNFNMIRATEAIDMLSAQLQEAQRAEARAKKKRNEKRRLICTSVLKLEAVWMQKQPRNGKRS
ncbi:hypothetical protein PsorP6_014922 [Peronosclerospora sorghi]|uniref:Uncharacterized protein n=1 Tax=Peronosclerospora sorghi TaxID=230839 RepID=A0ACC0VUE2_9STRA|nr:hypothetical protein PsorP6_014922 [Peronosclerospora sorghi]